jgi:hypothetical protein
MKVFVTGAETDKAIVFEALTKLHTKYCFNEVITEDREGLDLLVHQWCSLARLDVQALPNTYNDVENYHLCKIIKNHRPNMILAFPGWNENIKRYAQKYESVIEEISVAK